MALTGASSPPHAGLLCVGWSTAADSCSFFVPHLSPLSAQVHTRHRGDPQHPHGGGNAPLTPAGPSGAVLS